MSEYTQQANLFGLKPRIPGYNPTHIEHDGISGYEEPGMIADEFAFPPTLQHQFSPTAHQMPGIQADNATAMRVFLANPQYPPYGPAHPGVIHPPPFAWAPEGQALSLSLSSIHQGGANNSVGFRPIQEGFSYSTSCLDYTNHELPDHTISTVEVVRNSRYTTAARELLEEFCSVGRPISRKNQNHIPGIENSTNHEINVSGSDKITHQRRKAKLISMLDEVERRYNQYCEQLQAVVSSFERVMGSGSAAPYTTLAHKAMSRHFRCVKDAIMGEVKRSCEALGEDTAGTVCGLTRGETPRLKLLEQSLRQQRAFQQMGMSQSEQEAWRPQRGLPERSVNILRAWLFEHFLHPYPSDADKHMLARQTGLSRNQVSNWFINARVRLWKPMVEEMYQQENKEFEETRSNDTSTRTSGGAGWQLGDADPDPVGAVVDTQRFYDNQPKVPSDENDSHVCPTSLNYRMGMEGAYGTSGSFGVADVGSTMIRFGTTSGDVSLTLGLHHGGHRPENSPFSVKDYRGC